MRLIVTPPTPIFKCPVNAGACELVTAGMGSEHPPNVYSLGHVTHPPQVTSEGLLYIQYQWGSPCPRKSLAKSARIVFECDKDAGLVWYWSALVCMAVVHMLECIGLRALEKSYGQYWSSQSYHVETVSHSIATAHTLANTQEASNAKYLAAGYSRSDGYW